MYSATAASWIVCQLGAREHYSIPLTLLRYNKLHSLATDAWVHPESVIGIFHRRLRERYQADLAHASVKSWTRSLLAFEAASLLRRRSGWSLTIARNKWFQTRVARYLAAIPQSTIREFKPVVFSYSYTALAPFRIAKKRGWRTILGQIDPGRQHERIIADLYERHPQYADSRQFPPADYWKAWREECSLADVIVVNSEWSKEALLAEGIPAEQIEVVPLAYQPPSESRAVGRDYPNAISRQRPLRVLFLGNVNVCKGIEDLARAAELLKDAPVMFDVVGSHSLVPEMMAENVRFHGAVSRTEVSTWYRRADLFVLPTHSDGFGLTQPEAMAYGLPVIATTRCGQVVQPGLTGWLVEPGCPQQLAAVIRDVISHPTALAEMSAAATRRAREFSIERLSDHLCQLELSSGKSSGLVANH